MSDPWYRGRTGAYSYDIVGYQMETGARIEGVPAESLLNADLLTAVLITVHPKDDPEASRHFWVHNPMGGTPREWLNHIRIAAKRYGIVLEFDYDPSED